MPRKPKFRIPRVTTPATIYLVHWVDANHDTEYEGPSDDFAASLMDGYQVGHHVKTTKDVIVLAAESEVRDGANWSRYHMTIPRVHVRVMIPWGDAPNILAAAKEE